MKKAEISEIPTSKRIDTSILTDKTVNVTVHLYADDQYFLPYAVTIKVDSGFSYSESTVETTLSPVAWALTQTAEVRFGDNVAVTLYHGTNSFLPEDVKEVEKLFGSVRYYWLNNDCSPARSVLEYWR